jgi:hypothetical protein
MGVLFLTPIVIYCNLTATQNDHLEIQPKTQF